MSGPDHVANGKNGVVLLFANRVEVAKPDGGSVVVSLRALSGFRIIEKGGEGTFQLLFPGSADFRVPNTATDRIHTSLADSRVKFGKETADQFQALKVLLERAL